MCLVVIASEHAQKCWNTHMAQIAELCGVIYN